MAGMSQNIPEELLTIQDLKHCSELDNTEVEDILLDFSKLNFTSNLSNDPTDLINYNDGMEANPFDKISKYYGRNKNVFRVIYVLRNKTQSEKIFNMCKNLDDRAKDKFIKRMKIYLNRIAQGERDAKEFLNSDLDAFFYGYHVSCPEHNRNIHANLNINITQSGQALETSCFFSKKIQNFEEKSELHRVKIFSNGKRILNISKNEKQQRNYSFTKHASCNIIFSWNPKESGKDVHCFVVLSLNSGQRSIKKTAINEKNVKLEEILELAKQNDAILIENKSLYEALKKYLKVQHEEENVESSSTDSIALDKIPS